MDSHDGKAVGPDASPFQSYGVLLVLTVLPNVTVLPSIPPFPLLSGIPVAWLCIGMMLGRPPRLPLWMMPGRSVRERAGRGRIGRTLSWLDHRMSRQGGDIAPALLGSGAMRFHGICALIADIALCAPIPPVNVLGAVALLLLAVGLARRDGRIVVAGSILCIAAAAVVSLAMWAVVHALNCGALSSIDCVLSGERG